MVVTKDYKMLPGFNQLESYSICIETHIHVIYYKETLQIYPLMFLLDYFKVNRNSMPKNIIIVALPY